MQQRMQRGEKKINDPIHGYITLEPQILQFVDTPHFQRLRDLSQLGVVHYVFPGATHHRFEHSIGTAYLADKLLSGLLYRQPTLFSSPRVARRQSLLVKIAALCHDLGHGPFSHAFDSEFLPRVGITDWTHEEGSVMMFDSILDSNSDSVVFELDKNDRRFVHDLIHPPSEESKILQEESVDGYCSQYPKFLFDIVSNARNSVDVDKFDYLARDCHNIGMKLFYDSNRLIDNCRVIDDEICFHAKEVYNMYELFHTRFSLHKQVYTHRTVKAVEYMIIDAMIEADSVLQISKRIRDPEEYLGLTDAIVHEIEFSSDPRLEKSRQILKRLRRRDLYKMAAESVLQKPDYVTKIRAEDMTSCYSANGLLKPEDLIVQQFSINYGLKDKNPVERVSFYNSEDLDKKFKISSDKVSLLIPHTFSEQYVRVFVRDPTQEKLEAARTAMKRYLKNQSIASPSPAFIGKPRMTVISESSLI